MNDRKAIAAVLLLVMALVLATAGCTGQSPKSPQTVQPTSPPTTPPAFPAATTATKVLPTGPGTPGPTEALPDIYSMEFQVQANGNTADPQIGVALMGGKGMELNSRVDITFHRTTGQVENATMLPPFYMGQKAVFVASPDNYNRVEIWVTAPQVGKIKTYDDYVPFSTYNTNP